MLKTLIFSLIIVTIWTQNSCPIPQKDKTVLQSASIDIIPKMLNGGSLPQSQLTYVFVSGEQIPMDSQVALSISQMDVNPGRILKLGVRRHYINSSGLYFILEQQSNPSWISFRINFIITNRDDIEIGSVQTICQEPMSSLVLNYAIINQQLNNQRLKVKTFIRQIDLQTLDPSQKISLHYNRYFLDSNNSQIQLYFTSKSFVRYLGVSIILLRHQDENFGYLEGSNSQNYINSILSIQVPPLGKQEERVSMVGMQSFDLDGRNLIAIFTHLQNGYKLQFGSSQPNCQINFLQVGYLIVTVYQCTHCKMYQYLHDNRCIVKCPDNTRPVKGTCIQFTCKDRQYSVGNKCRPCPKRSKIPQCKNDCEKGEELVGEQCISKCQPNQTSSQNGCQCQKDYYRMADNSCKKCLSPQVFNLVTRSCVGNCNPLKNQVLVDGVCRCAKKFFNINNSCCKCPNNTRFNQINKVCQLECGLNQYYQNGRCVCLSLYKQVNGHCSQCPYGTYYKNDRCVQICNVNEQYRGSRCVCIQGYFRISNFCSKCPLDQYYMPQNQSCVFSCSSNYKLQGGVCRRLCSADQIYEQSIQQCRCDSSYTITSGNCRDKEYKVGNLCLKCCSGYFFDQANLICHRNCRSDERYNSDTKECQCRNGAVKNNNVCTQQCPDDRQKDGKSCELKCTDTNKIFNTTSNQCECRSGTKNVENKCVACQQCQNNQICLA